MTAHAKALADYDIVVGLAEWRAASMWTGLAVTHATGVSYSTLCAEPVVFDDGSILQYEGHTTTWADGEDATEEYFTHDLGLSFDRRR